MATKLSVKDALAEIEGLVDDYAPEEAVQEIEAGVGADAPVPVRSDTFWDAVAVCVREIPKGQDVIRFEACTRGGKGFVNVRQFYTDRATGDMRPGKQGIALPVTALEELFATFLDAQRMSEK